MRAAVEEELKSKSGTIGNRLAIETIDGENIPKDAEPGRWILDNVADEDIGSNYREGRGETIDAYIGRTGALAGKILWLKGLDRKQTTAWLDFSRRYQPGESQFGLVVIESRYVDDAEGMPTIVRYGDRVSSYDVQSFARYLLDFVCEDTRYSPPWKTYIASLLAHVCDTDSELCEWIAQDADFKADGILPSLHRASVSHDFCLRGGEPESQHVLSKYRSGEMNDVSHRVWVAQVESLFPLIEIERLEIIDRIRPSLQEALDSLTVEQYKDDHKERVRNPNEVELGTLVFLMAKSRGYLGTWLKVDGALRSRIIGLSKCRNNIAHLEVCSPAQVRFLLDRADWPEDFPSYGN